MKKSYSHKNLLAALVLNINLGASLNVAPHLTLNETGDIVMLGIRQDWESVVIAAGGKDGKLNATQIIQLKQAASSQC